MFKAIIFDFDGVLVDSMPAHVKAWRKVGAEYGWDVSPQEIKLREGEKAAVTAKQMFENHGVNPSEKQVVMFLQKKRNYYAEYAPSNLNEDAGELLRNIKHIGLKLALVTGSIHENINRVMTSEDRALFDVIITGDEVLNGKPDPEPYIRALKLLNVEPSECLVIENAPLGIQAAKSAGMKVAAITSTLPPEKLAEADWIMDNLEGVEVILNSTEEN